jgi:hypothetical protein
VNDAGAIRTTMERHVEANRAAVRAMIDRSSRARLA